MKRKIFNILLIVILILIDQISKILIIKCGDVLVINNSLNFTYIENTGGAYSLGSGHVNWLIVINIIIIALVILYKNYILKEKSIGIDLIIAGGIANLIDRIFRGFVVDFIDFTNIIKFPIFNIADIYIVIGAILVFIQIIKCRDEHCSSTHKK